MKRETKYVLTYDELCDIVRVAVYNVLEELGVLEEDSEDENNE